MGNTKKLCKVNSASTKAEDIFRYKKQLVNLESRQNSETKKRPWEAFENKGGSKIGAIEDMIFLGTGEQAMK